MSEEKIDWSAHANEATKGQVDEQLGIIGELSASMVQLQDEMDALQEQLKEKQKIFLAISQGSLPEAMQAIGLTAITDNQGRKLSIKTFYQAKIPDARKVEAWNYLKETGNEALIKTDVTAKFGMGEAEKAKEAQDALDKLGIVCGVKIGVHHSTLKAFVKEQIEAGVEGFPTDLFGVYIGNKVEIK